MQTVAITGASGFVGGRLVQRLARRPDLEIRLLIRGGSAPPMAHSDRVVVVEGDLVDPVALSSLLRPGCDVVNLAYDANAGAHVNLTAAAALGQACSECQVKRLIHCSTAVVVGRTGAVRIDESAVCKPQRGYEETKLAIEHLLLDAARGSFEIAILRPTAVFGPGGKNLLKLAHDLKRRPRWANYLRSCANGRRRMNLVDVDNVTAAAAHLLKSSLAVDGQAFIVSDDEEPENNFRDVERRLMSVFGMPDYTLPRIAVPKSVLAFLLRMRGRSLTNPDTVFVSDKLQGIGFSKPVEFTVGLTAFAQWYQTAFG